MCLELLKLVASGAILGQSRAYAPTPESLEGGHCATMKREVAILGGGSSGTYTAIRLKDSGKSVVVIEAEDALGGHTVTYTDSVTGQRDEVGVVSFHDLDVVRDYFARLDIPLETQVQATPNRTYFDFQSRRELKDYQLPDPAETFGGYYAQLLKYPELLEGFDKLPDSVPEDLLLPFGQFTEKYDIQDVVPIIALYGQGGIDYDQITTLYILKYMGPSFVKGLDIGTLTTARHNNHELYEAAYDALGSQNVLLNSSVSAATRSDDGVQLHVVSANGSCVNIRAEKLVVSVAPTLDKLSPLSLDKMESGLFQRFTNVSYFTSVGKEFLMLFFFLVASCSA